MNPAAYTHTRIKKSYLSKLQALAKHNKRSALKQLEFLIDESYKKDYDAYREHQRQAALTRKNRMTPEQWSEMSRRGALARHRKV